MSLSDLSVDEKEQCVLRYKNGVKLDELVKYYRVSRSTIYRWVKKYDGNTASLQPEVSRKFISHPRKMPLNEEKQLIKIVQNNPHITNKKLSELLGTNRSPAFLHRKRIKLMGNRIIPHKNDIKTFFNDNKISLINQNDYKIGKISKKFYIIEITKNLYVQKNNARNPVSITPYFSMCLQFKSKEEASAFLVCLGDLKSKWLPKVREVKEGILQI